MAGRGVRWGGDDEGRGRGRGRMGEGVMVKGGGRGHEISMALSERLSLFCNGF